MLRRRILLEKQPLSAHSEYVLIAALFGSAQLSIKGGDYAQILNTASWYAASMTPTGQYMALAASGDGIWQTNDYGDTWVRYAAQQSWRDIFIVASGQYRLASPASGYLTISANYGASYNSLMASGSKTWLSASCSDNAQYITGVAYGDRIHVSNDYGATFTAIGGVSMWRNWVKIAMSTDGRYQMAVAEYNFSSQVYTHPYLSSDFGAIWTPIQLANNNYKSVCVSASGQYIYIAAVNSIIHSSDYGHTFREVFNTSLTIVDVQCTHDASLVYVLCAMGEVYVSHNHQDYMYMSAAAANAKQIAISNSNN